MNMKLKILAICKLCMFLSKQKIGPDNFNIPFEM